MKKNKSNNMLKNVTTEVNKLCTFCGGCVAVCPYNSLKIKSEQIILDGKCDSCGLCLKVCPAKDFEFKKFNKILFKDKSFHPSIGYFDSLYAAHASDESIRENASSGGIVTALLVYALEKGFIQGVISTRSDNKKPYSPQIFIARTKEDLLKAQGSKYCLSPTNSILRKIKDISNQDAKFALVGLPCQIQNIRRMQAVGLYQNITLLIGLFCGWNMNFKGTEYLLDQVNINKKNVADMKYRFGEWPGGFYVRDKLGKQYKLKKHDYDFPNMMFIPKRCFVCSDYMSEYADISIGDCWIKGYKKSSSVVLRTNNGCDLYKSALEAGYITHDLLSLNTLIESHNHNIKFKRSAHIRGKLQRFKINFNPNNYLSKPKKLNTLLMYYIVSISQTKLFKKYFPFKVMSFIANFRRYVKGTK